MKELKKVSCPGCGTQIDVTRHGKYAPHNHHNARCSWSGSRVIPMDKEKASEQLRSS